MPQDDLSALNTKMDFLIGKTEEQGKQLAKLQRQFDESRGALGLIKTCAWIAGIAAAVWAAFHGGRP